MSKKASGILLATLLMVSGSAFADSFYFASAGNNVWDNVYVNPYTANETSPQTINNLTIYCDDWNTEFSGNPTWTASVYAFSQSNVPSFKYGGVTSDAVSLSGGQLLNTPAAANAYDLYLEAIYLDEQMQNGGNSALQQQEYSAAEWTLFVSSSNAAGLISAINGSVSGFETAVYNDLLAAQTGITQSGFSTAGWDVVEPDPASSFQEFLTYDFPGNLNQPNVPEPGAIVLLGTIVGLLGLTKFRRGRQA
jgi:hypothetical protein